MKNKSILICIVLACLLTACGGGSSSSGGASSANSANDGRYSGMQTVNAMVSNSNSQAVSVTFVMAVEGNNVSILDTEFTASGAIVDGAFSVDSGEVVFVDEQLNCQGNVVYVGRVENQMSNGSFNGQFNCIAAGFDVPPIIITGTFTAMLNPSAPAAGTLITIMSGLPQ